MGPALADQSLLRYPLRCEAAELPLEALVNRRSSSGMSMRDLPDDAAGSWFHKPRCTRCERVRTVLDFRRQASVQFPQRPAPWPRRAATTSGRSEAHTSELQSLMRISYAVLCLKKKKKN